MKAKIARKIGKLEENWENGNYFSWHPKWAPYNIPTVYINGLRLQVRTAQKVDLPYCMFQSRTEYVPGTHTGPRPGTFQFTHNSRYFRSDMSFCPIWPICPILVSICVAQIIFDVTMNFDWPFDEQQNLNNSIHFWHVPQSFWHQYSLYYRI